MYIQAENKYGKYFIPKDSIERPCSKTILKGEVWEADTVKCIIDNAHADIVHCGTFFGDMLPPLSKNTNNTIFAFEPNPISFKAATKCVLENNLSNVKLLNAGLSNKESEEWFDASAILGGKSKFTKNDNSIKVNTVTLDSIITKPVSVIHLDVEGHEIFALMGAIETIKKYKPVLILEFIHYTKQDGWSEIINLGYKNVKKCNANFVWSV